MYQLPELDILKYEDLEASDVALPDGAGEVGPTR